MVVAVAVVKVVVSVDADAVDVKLSQYPGLTEQNEVRSSIVV